MLVDPTKTHIFIWVPGTGGHEVHPDFATAIEKIVGDDAQVIVCDYPALWNFEDSVPYGEMNLKGILRMVAGEKTPEQKVYVAGSSQGAWVITNVYNPGHSYNEVYGVDGFDYKSVAHKTVLFGHPGVATLHDHDHSDGGSLWEINDLDDDAVTFEWGDEQRKLVRAVVFVQQGKLQYLPTILWAMVKHPVRAFKFVWLILSAMGVITWVDSPHEYANQMPLAVYWLVN